jgi:hypothetical protein
MACHKMQLERTSSMLTKIGQMTPEEIWTKLRVAMHSRDQGLVVKYKPGTEPRQWKDVGSGLCCQSIDESSGKLVLGAEWSGAGFDYHIDQIVAVLSHDEVEELAPGADQKACADLFE